MGKIGQQAKVKFFNLSSYDHRYQSCFIVVKREFSRVILLGKQKKSLNNQFYRL